MVNPRGTSPSYPIFQHHEKLALAYYLTAGGWRILLSNQIRNCNANNFSRRHGRKAFWTPSSWKPRWYPVTGIFIRSRKNEQKKVQHPRSNRPTRFEQETALAEDIRCVSFLLSLCLWPRCPPTCTFVNNIPHPTNVDSGSYVFIYR
jgi:hypothetical protein